MSPRHALPDPDDVAPATPAQATPPPPPAAPVAAPAPATEPAARKPRKTHAHTHTHSHHGGPVENLAHFAKPLVVGLLTVIAVATAVGAIFLWPTHSDHPIPVQFRSADGGPIKTVQASVIAQSRADCGTMGAGSVSEQQPMFDDDSDTTGACIASVAELTSGPDKGNYTVLSTATNRAQSGTGPDHYETHGSPDDPIAGQPTFKVGDKLRLSMSSVPDGGTRYSFFDYQRGIPLLFWAIAFVVAVVAVATWRGLRAVIGLAFAFAILAFFALPSILDGHSPVAVAVVSASAILFPVLYLAHGLSMRTSSALLGTLASLGLAVGLSKVAVSTLSLTGLSGESTMSLQLYQGSISLSGLLLAGFVIGTLGVLNDVTITQASATFELASVPGESRMDAFRGGMRVGRDHIASTVYTLVFAYAGAALPLLLLFYVAGQPVTGLITGEAVAIELARTFVGGIALALSVPLTTAIAAALVTPIAKEPATTA
ncbi:MAG: YibE/F family protein [Gordonia sp. (in: high G+C Gram-positive bacteria)]|uniref:YibE/F family protein n=1 Tax=Gordonia sp. (in: high G+C Gram-positive bacteria) TaxID=84139 RepID=UPI0039E56009